MFSVDRLDNTWVAHTRLCPADEPKNITEIEGLRLIDDLIEYILSAVDSLHSFSLRIPSGGRWVSGYHSRGFLCNSRCLDGILRPFFNQQGNFFLFHAAKTANSFAVHLVDRSLARSLRVCAYGCPRSRSVKVRLKRSTILWSRWMFTRPLLTSTLCFASSWLAHKVGVICATSTTPACRCFSDLFGLFFWPRQPSETPWHFLTLQGPPVLTISYM